MTDGERLLWSRLRGKLLGVKFRRQHPLGTYIADFACLDPKLIVEIDGSQHAQQLAYDRQRDDFFKQQGFGVLRFPANLPFTALQSVVEAIFISLTELDAARAPIPAFPQWGKERKKIAEFPLSELGKEKERFAKLHISSLGKEQDTIPELPLPAQGKELSKIP